MDKDLVDAVSNNPGCGLTLSQIDGATVALMLEGGNDGPSWHWLVSLPDGSWAYVAGWCDYTGWDCRSGAEAHLAENRDAAMALVPDVVRVEFEAMAVAGEMSRRNTVDGW